MGYFLIATVLILISALFGYINTRFFNFGSGFNSW